MSSKNVKFKTKKSQYEILKKIYLFYKTYLMTNTDLPSPLLYEFKKCQSFFAKS